MPRTPDPQAVALPLPGHSPDLIHADVDYFYTKARQCFRLARQAKDAETAEALRTLGIAFEVRANAPDEDPIE